MKKFFGFVFWVGLIGGGFYFYKKNPHLREYCKLITDRISEIISQHHCSSPQEKVEEEE
ncbi:MAG: hypothetical protein K8S23_10655 [Candidatus Cloacimonetes bacterium]|nr:hypothetical protein [Candidatus Cloacimonadota bacterium]